MSWPRSDLNSTRGEIARLLHRLGWAAIAACALVGQPGRVAVGFPAALVAADCLRQLGPLLVPGGRRYIEWAAIASGGAATAAALSWVPAGPEPGFTAYFVVGSITFSLYALGLAAWVAPVDHGHLARRLRASVVVWWVMIAAASVGFAAGGPTATAPDDGATIDGRLVSDWLFFLIAGLMAVAYILLAGAHHVVKITMRELAAEDSAARSDRAADTR